MAPPGVHPVFPTASPRSGLYESFFLRAVSPEEPLGVWIRYTVHKPPGQPPLGSLWLTLLDARLERPLMRKLTTHELSVPPGGWIAVGDSQLGPSRAEGVCGGARWSLALSSSEPPLRHLPSALLYRAPLPRTKLTSPLPAARFDGVLEVPEPTSQASSPPPARAIELRGWPGMVGHNWGAEHAERWIWLHGIGFHEDPHAWIDLAVGRVRLAGRTSPWVANGALHLDGERHRLGGPWGRGLLVAETPRRCTIVLTGAHGLRVEAHVQSAPQAIAGWCYADPDGGSSRGGRHGDPPQRGQHGDSPQGSRHGDPPQGSRHDDPPQGGRHDVCNCSIAALTLTVRRPGRPARTLRTHHGAAYELGMRERDHGVPIFDG